MDRIIRKKILAGGFTHGTYKDKESYSYIKKNRMGHSARVDDPCRRYQSTGHIFLPDPKVYAWWGTIYPEFCFEKVEDNGENKPVKISFWLAKALDW